MSKEGTLAPLRMGALLASGAGLSGRSSCKQRHPYHLWALMTHPGLAVAHKVHVSECQAQ